MSNINVYIKFYDDLLSKEILAIVVFDLKGSGATQQKKVELQLQQYTILALVNFSFEMNQVHRRRKCAVRERHKGKAGILLGSIIYCKKPKQIIITVSAYSSIFSTLWNIL